MRAILRASVSVDGKLLNGAGNPLQRGISPGRLLNAEELLLTVHPVIVGDDSAWTITGIPADFLPEDLEWDLVSAAEWAGGAIMARYRRRKIRAKRVSRPSPEGA